VDVPRQFLRNEAMYRTAPARAPLAVPGAGVQFKPTDRGAYRDRVHHYYVLVYVLSGSGLYVDFRGEEHRVSAGCAIQMPAERKHSVVHDADGRWCECWFLLHADVARSFKRIGLIDESRLLLRVGVDLALADRFESILQTLKHEPDNALTGLVVTSADILNQMHVQDARLRQPHPREMLVDRARRQLEQHLDRRIDVAQLLEGTDISYERFRKIFRERTGVSPGEYRIRKRIDRARALLTEGSLSTKEIAYTLGYRDPFTFSKQFKQVVGVSPAAFRAMG
jgi:AraC-like DNA-binding protein